MKSTFRKSLLIFLLAFAVVLVIALVLIYRTEPQPIVDAIERREVEQEQPAVETPIDSEATAFDEKISELVSPEEESLRPEHVSKAQWAVFLEERRVRKVANGKLEFYGKIVDGDGNPLPNVTVIAETFYHESSLVKLVRTGNAMPKNKFEVTSDESGEFSVEGDLATKLTLSQFDKEGYRIEGRTYYPFWFGADAGSRQHNADPANPVEFVMRKVEP